MNVPVTDSDRADSDERSVRPVTDAAGSAETERAASSSTPGDGGAGPTSPTPVRRPSRADLDRIFGTEPTSTRDDLPDPEPTRSDDSWFIENRPPHHGG